MHEVALIGKLYQDKIVYVNGIMDGETNQYKTIIEKKGGMYNFDEAHISDIKFNFIPTGKKDAFIVSDVSTTTRTSFVKNIEDGKILKNTVKSINKNYDWLHVCYIDDIEEYRNLSLTTIPYSLDFCTLKERNMYINIIHKAEVIFDSRERKNLYRFLNTNTPIVFHDESGVEIVKNKKKLISFDNTPIKNLDVNGAGDIYAAHFIKNYFEMDLNESTYRAMIDTTKHLQRERYEKI